MSISQNTEDFSHESVMPDEVLQYLEVKSNGIYLDGTAGGGGHSGLIAQRLTTGRLYSLDRDKTAVAVTAKRLEMLNVTVINGNFRDAKTLLAPYDVDGLDGALLDLGVSSHQFDTPERGFSYRFEAPLDMRMGESTLTAYDIVNTYSKQEIQSILFEYADEKNAGFIATKIVKAREEKPINTTTELVDIVTSALPSAVRRKNKNPAKKTFQALRIAVNDEMGALRDGLSEIFDLLKPGGRLTILTFHSIEDRIVKKYFKSLCEGCICPKSFPICVCGNTPKAKLPIKYVKPSEAECERNRRASSAVLRVVEKI